MTCEDLLYRFLNGAHRDSGARRLSQWTTWNGGVPQGLRSITTACGDGVWKGEADPISLGCRLAQGPVLNQSNSSW